MSETHTPYLANPTRTLAVLERYGFSIQKKYGQNFLIDANILEEIMEASGITKEDYVLEIGPGIGTMTQYLARDARRVTAVEIDRMLIPILSDTLADFPNAEVIHGDILKVDIAALVQEKNQGRPIRVVANLPYYITTPIIMELLERRLPLKSITIMVQKEVADRMRTGPGSKDYGALSLAVQYYTKPSLVTEVPPSCFLPQPGVGSAVMHLECYEEPPVRVKNEQLLFDLIRASFNQRRKTLANGIKNASNLPFSREDVEKALSQMEKSATVRGEALTLQEFARLSDLLDTHMRRR